MSVLPFTKSDRAEHYLPVTKARVRVLLALREFTETHGYPPSIRELTTRLSLKSPSTIHNHLETLIDQGYLRSDAGRARTWKLTSKGRDLTTPLKAA